MLKCADANGKFRNEKTRKAEAEEDEERSCVFVKGNQEQQNANKSRQSRLGYPLP